MQIRLGIGKMRPHALERIGWGILAAGYLYLLAHLIIYFM